MKNDHFKDAFHALIHFSNNNKLCRVFAHPFNFSLLYKSVNEYELSEFHGDADGTAYKIEYEKCSLV